MSQLPPSLPLDSVVKSKNRHWLVIFVISLISGLLLTVTDEKFFTYLNPISAAIGSWIGGSLFFFAAGGIANWLSSASSARRNAILTIAIVTALNVFNRIGTSEAEKPNPLVRLFRSLYPDEVTTQPSADGEAVFIRSSQDGYSWVMPNSWERTQSFTTSKYAFKLRGSSATSLSLLVVPSNETSQDFIREWKANPQELVEGIKARFPNAKFLGSELTKVGAHDAVIQKVEYQQEALGRTFEFYLLQVIAVRAGRMYVFSYEILKGDVKAEALLPILQNAMTGFVFL
jgi:hypothetical protein